MQFPFLACDEQCEPDRSNQKILDADQITRATACICAYVNVLSRTCRPSKSDDSQGF